MILPWSEAREELIKRIGKRAQEWATVDSDGKTVFATVEVARWRVRRGSATVASSGNNTPDDWMVALDEALSRLPSSDYIVELGRARSVTGSSTFDICSITISWDPAGQSPQIFLTAQYREMAELSRQRARDAEADRDNMFSEMRKTMIAMNACQRELAEVLPNVVRSSQAVTGEVSECVTSASKLYLAACQEAAQMKIDQAQNSFWTSVVTAVKDDFIHETKTALPTIRGMLELGVDLARTFGKRFLLSGGK